MLLHTILENSANKYPDRTAVVYQKNKWSYEQFASRARKCACALSKAGVKRGDHVVLIAKNSYTYLEIIFACSLVGAVSEHYNLRWSPCVVDTMLSESCARVLFYSSTMFATELPLQTYVDRGILCIDIDDDNSYNLFLEAGTGQSIQCESLSSKDYAFQMFTSGTTGRPRGVMLTHHAIISQLFASCHDGDWRTGEVYLCVLPLFHVPVISTLRTIFVSGTVVISQTRKIEEIVSLIDEHKVTCTTVVPALFKALLDYKEANQEKLDSLRMIHYGAARFEPAMIRRAQKIFDCGFCQGYGMTEMASSVTMLLPQWHFDDYAIQSVGKPIIGVEVKIIDETGRECSVREVGEISICAESMMAGYVENGVLVSDSICDGWYRSGDLGYFDERGYLFLCGRKDDLIISGGENIYPCEIELCISGIGKSITAVAVIGVEDSLWGQVPIAFVEVDKAGSISEEEIINHCAINLGRFKRPKKVIFIDKLPRGATGKIDVFELRKLYLDNIEDR